MFGKGLIVCSIPIFLREFLLALSVLLNQGMNLEWEALKPPSNIWRVILQFNNTNTQRG